MAAGRAGGVQGILWGCTLISVHFVYVLQVLPKLWLVTACLILLIAAATASSEGISAPAEYLGRRQLQKVS